VLELITQLVFNLGYGGFFLYMVVVGTFIPLPTQLILLPAGYLVSQGKLDAIIIVFVTASGTTLGAFINYNLANAISKRFISHEKIEKIEHFFNKYGKFSVFLAPLSFGLGQYISLPAGMAKMPLLWFIPLIFLSNALWNSAMLSLGYFFGNEANSYVGYLIGGGTIVIVLTISIFVYREFKSYR
jgi:membrane protein DedA with SNARE-associated domain